MYTFLSDELDLLDSVIIHASVSLLELEEFVHTEGPWLWIFFQHCLFSRLCSRLTMWWLTRSTVTRRWGWLPRQLHLTWTETRQTALTETWTWRMSPGSAWFSFRRTLMSQWWVDTNNAVLLIHKNVIYILGGFFWGGVRNCFISIFNLWSYLLGHHSENEWP